MLLSCPGCEKVSYKELPIYFKLNGIVYKRPPDSMIITHSFLISDSGFEYILRGDFTGQGQTVDLYLRAGDSSSSEIELNKRYVIKENTRLTTYNESTIKRHKPVTGWIMFTDEEVTDSTLAMTGNFEIIFEGYTEDEDIVISDGCINSLSCSRYKASGEIPQLDKI